jgi:hypothetical protein
MSSGSRLLALAILALLPPVSALGYPTYVRQGYVSCSACHVSPQGSGILTDYGKGVGASASAFPREYTPGKWLPGAIQVRGLGYTSGAKTDALLMQLDYLNSTELGRGFRGDLTVGLVPPSMVSAGRAGQGVFGEATVLRKALFAYRPEDGWELALGRDYLPTGLNIDDHTSFLRSENRRSPFDYATQVRLDLWKERFLATPFLFAPSFEENPDNREYGGGARLERALAEDKTVGLGGLYGDSRAVERFSLSVFSRIGLLRTFGLLSQVSLTRRRLHLGSGDIFGQETAYLRPFYAPFEWMELGWTGELLRRGAPFADRAIQQGPDLYLRVVRELTLILDGKFLSRDDRTQTLFSVQALGQL